VLDRANVSSLVADAGITVAIAVRVARIIVEIFIFKVAVQMDLFDGLE
jgi:hypothetical protein